MFEGRVVLVTGGGSGIGAAIVRAFAAAGARLCVSDISEEAVQALVDEVGRDRAIAVVGDCACTEDAERMVSLAITAFGQLDVAVNNAGIGGSGRMLADIPEDHFDRVVGVNLKGVWQGMRHQIPVMLAAGQGVIVNMASTMGLKARMGSAEYIATKHGVVGLTKAAAVEYSSRGIRINAVCPGVIETPLIQSRATDPATVQRLRDFHPIGRLGHAEEVASAVLWLASPGAGFVTGAAIPVDGGWTAH